MKNIYYIKMTLHGLAAFCAAASSALANPPTTTYQWVVVGLGAIGAASVAVKAYLSEASIVDTK